MLNKIKNFINQATTTEPVVVPFIPVAPVIETTEQKIAAKFEQFYMDMTTQQSFPNRALQPLEGILKTIKEMDSQTISLQDQALIRRIVDNEIPQMVELYLSLPKGHAVSFVLENGKTSKETLVEKMMSLQKQVATIWDEAVAQKTELLIKKQKASNQIYVVKKDFFEL